MNWFAAQVLIRLLIVALAVATFYALREVGVSEGAAAVVAIVNWTLVRP